MNDQTELFTPKTAAKMVGVDAELLKVWCNEFNIQTERTEGGHRRYSRDNIATLQEIRKKIQEQNWSYDQVRAWLNGSIEAFTTTEQRSELDKKADKLLEEAEQQKQFRDNQTQFNQALVQRLDELVQRIANLEQQNQQMIEERKLLKAEIHEIKQQNEQLKSLFGERDQFFLGSLKQSMEKTKKKRTGILAKLFSKE
ncbi:MerR family transcriptional regulator [Saccharococcus thermophilus]|uniref:DNA-binding transcriptional MerR regulator n=1 Tax=Saccharococcus thermophilus TaxID=29396 RepID=A0A846MLP7_9BACL|nr:DNA-binding transcriptional MerR regulator [Saccharococcus thermophilus]NIK16596.1 DNA-binding transcriptional MerR regulator [Saccharococcus thermophilus]